MRINEEDVAAGAWYADLWYSIGLGTREDSVFWSELPEEEQQRYVAIARTVTADVLGLVVARLSAAIADGAVLTGQRERPRSYDEGVTDALDIVGVALGEIRERSDR